MLSTGPLTIGLRHALHVREERVSARHDACRLLYVSDIHLRNGRSSTLCRQVLDSVTRSRPDAVKRIFDSIWAFRANGQFEELPNATLGSSVKAYGVYWLIVGILLGMTRSTIE